LRRAAFIAEPYANRDQIAEPYANLGWLGIPPSEVYANMGCRGEGGGDLNFELHPFHETRN
jgi:hypothetical protein